MKKTIFLLGLFISSFSLTGCNISEQRINNEIDINTGIIEQQENIIINDDRINGYIASGITIPGENIILSGGYLFYNNEFSIKLLDELTDRKFNKEYGKNFWVMDRYIKKKLNISDITSGGKSCNDFFESEYISKSKYTKNQQGININITKVNFAVYSPERDPIKVWEVLMCFKNKEKKYIITISDDSKFRTDIINSFKFLK